MNLNWLLAIRGRAPRKAEILLGLTPIAVIGIVWFCITWGPVEERVISPNILPSPGEVVQSVPLLFAAEKKVHFQILVSLRRVGVAFLLAVGLTVPLGILMGSLGSVRAMFTPVTTASGYIPIATLVPLTMSWFGTGELMKVMFLALAFGIFLLPQVVRAVAGVPDIFVRTASTLGVSRWQMICRVLVPVAMPDIWNSMRMAFGVGWTYLVLAEVVVLDDGLGFLVAISQRRGPREHIYLVIVIITLIAWFADFLWVRIGSLLFPYKRSQT
jgi:ABC-type nitrate/sulfonate/bicarbonate transport system permease component